MRSVRSGGRRLAAWAVDCGCLVGFAGAVAAVGVPLHLAGATRGLDPLAVNALGAGLLVAPAVTGCALLESRAPFATPGKRVLRLAVRGADGPLPLGRALLRNAIKIGLPWLVGHAAVVALVTAPDPVPVGVWALTAGAYVLPAVWIGSLLTVDGRTPYDRMAGSRVGPAGTAAHRR